MPCRTHTVLVGSRRVEQAFAQEPVGWRHLHQPVSSWLEAASSAPRTPAFERAVGLSLLPRSLEVNEDASNHSSSIVG